MDCRSTISKRIRGFALLFLIVASALHTGSAAAQTLSVAETEALVRARYYEGLPEAEAARIGPEGAARLVEMLADSAERPNHDQILLALGLCGSPDALLAIRQWRQRTPRVGEIDRDTFRAWQALPYALGHLARFDRRAVGELEGLLGEPAPGWTFRHHVGARLLREQRRAVATSLAETGLPEARRVLDRAVGPGAAASDPDFADHVRSLRTLRAERAPVVGR